MTDKENNFAKDTNVPHKEQIIISNRRQGKNIYTLINELDQLKETNEELKNIIKSLQNK